MESPNFDHWETLAAFHGTGSDRFYDVDALIAGHDSFTDLEENALALATANNGVEGLDVVHIQSHIGFDSISMARRGARVTAVDFSPTALRRANEIAALAGVSLETVQSDSRDLPTHSTGVLTLPTRQSAYWDGSTISTPGCAQRRECCA